MVDEWKRALFPSTLWKCGILLRCMGCGWMGVGQCVRSLFWCGIVVLLMCIPFLWVGCCDTICWIMRSVCCTLSQISLLVYQLLRRSCIDFLVKYFYCRLIYLGHQYMFVMQICAFILPFYPILWLHICDPIFSCDFFINDFPLIHSTNSNIFLFISWYPCRKVLF